MKIIKSLVRTKFIVLCRDKMEKHSDVVVGTYHHDKKYSNILELLNDSTFNFPERSSPLSIVHPDKSASDVPQSPPQRSPPPLPISKFTRLKTQRPYDFDFELEKGQECISMQNLKLTTVPVFLGYCYFCDCPKHSQNFCPLRFCQICSLYGHSARVCPKNSAHGNENWRCGSTVREGSSGLSPLLPCVS